jgi:uncharacterized lipoprotein YajG
LPLTASPRVCEMKRYTYLMIRTLLVLTIFAILITAGCQKQPQTQEQPEEKAAPPLPVVSAFYVNGRGENSSFTSFCEHKDIMALHQIPDQKTYTGTTNSKNKGVYDKVNSVEI